MVTYKKEKISRNRITGNITVEIRTYKVGILWDTLLSIETIKKNMYGHVILPCGKSQDAHGNYYTNTSTN